MVQANIWEMNQVKSETIREVTKSLEESREGGISGSREEGGREVSEELKDYVRTEVLPCGLVRVDYLTDSEVCGRGGLQGHRGCFDQRAVCPGSCPLLWLSQ